MGGIWNLEDVQVSNFLRGCEKTSGREGILQWCGVESVFGHRNKGVRGACRLLASDKI